MFIIKNQKGIILINLLAGIAIITLLFAVAIPYLRLYQPNLKLNSTARDFTSDLRYAQQLTITEQVPYKVSMDLTNDSYSILKVDTSTTTIKTVDFDSSVSYQQVNGFTNNIVEFNYYGGVSESGTITLLNTNGITKIINIKPSGYVQLDN